MAKVVALQANARATKDANQANVRAHARKTNCVRAAARLRAQKHAATKMQRNAPNAISQKVRQAAANSPPPQTPPPCAQCAVKSRDRRNAANNRPINYTPLEGFSRALHSAGARELFFSACM